MDFKMKDLLIDFGLPTLILIMLFTLIVTGLNGEIKTLFAAICGWIVYGGVTKIRKIK